jgi:uncharacterized protein
MAVVSRVKWLPRRLRSRDKSTSPAYIFNPADFIPKLQTRLLILQPTPFCNIACDYCYLPDRNSTARMEMSTVRLAAERLRNDGLAGNALTVVWHAGEPLAMPRPFYEEAVAVIHDVFGSACEVTHSIQTNGTLIDDAWCELIKRHRIHIGVSVDGPAELHDAHRRGRSGKGTHARVLRGMDLLRKHGIPFHTIAVVTAKTFAQADAFYDFFAQQRVSELSCNFDEAEGLHTSSSLAGNEAAHASFFSYLLERSANAGRELRIREISTAFQLISKPLPTYRWQGRDWPANDQTLPFALISVAHNGDFSSFSPELLGQPSIEFDNFILGNVLTGSYLDSARGERFRRLWGAIVNGTRECERTCSHYGFCGGGAPANKFYENGDLESGETLYCRTMLKRPFDSVLARLERDWQTTGASS